MSKLRSITCHIGSHSITCHPDTGECDLPQPQPDRPVDLGVIVAVVLVTQTTQTCCWDVVSRCYTDRGHVSVFQCAGICNISSSGSCWLLSYCCTDHSCCQLQELYW